MGKSDAKTFRPWRESVPASLWGGAAVGLVVLLSASCGDGGGTGGDATTVTDTGGAVLRSCEGQPPADLGRCQLAGGGACMGAPDEPAQFASLSDGETMRMVIGPQGSTMLVFAIRAPGIERGSMTSDQPLVEVALLDRANGRQIALYRSRTEFSAGSPPEALELWVVVDDLAGELGGRSVRALATVRDSTGLELCGSAQITVGR